MTAIENYWLRYYIDYEHSLCSLCGNSGKIDTRGRAVSAAGVDAGRLNFCICPNGVGLRKRLKGFLEDGPQRAVELDGEGK